MDLEGDREDGWMQERYARWIDGCLRAALAATLLAFGAYATSIAPAYVPLEQLPALWQLPLARYLEATRAPSGWSWLGYLRFGDYLNYVGIALLALVVLACHAAMIRPLLARGERLLALLAAAQAAVLVFAASGLFAGG